MDLPNIDTDRVIPARFLRKPREVGFGPFLFHDVRFDADGSEKGEFILNQSPLPGREDPGHRRELRLWLLAREAVWALMDHGIRVVIGPSFGDIFFENCFKNGVLAVVLPAAEAACVGALSRSAPAPR